MVPVEKTNRTIKAILDKSVGVGWRSGTARTQDLRRGSRPVVDVRDALRAAGSGCVLGEPRRQAWIQGRRKELRRSRRRGSSPDVSFRACACADGKPRDRLANDHHLPPATRSRADGRRARCLLVGDKQLITTALEPFGLYAGIARAILERQIRSFAKAANPKKSTKQIRREVDDFLRSQGRL